MFNFEHLPFNFGLLLKFIAKRGIELKYLGDTDAVAATLGCHTEYLVNYLSNLTPANYYILLSDKFYSKSLMRFCGISVVEGQVFDKQSKQEVLDFATQIGYPVVLKPTNGSEGNFVYPNLQDEKELTYAFKDFSNYTNQCNMLLEKHFHGKDYRFVVIDGVKEPFVVSRSLPEITGDGVHSIKELVEQENHRRITLRTNCLCRLYYDDPDSLRTLRHQSLTPDSIVGKGISVKLRYNANVSWGSDCETIENHTVHASYLQLAKKIHALLPGNKFTAVDLLIEDISQPCTSLNYVFCEFNCDPGFSLHHLPSRGKAQNIIDPIIDLLFPETKQNHA
ncbi:cyanophycin synthetase [Legionella santicrucis]|uniref:Cyanophycin synthetase n=1 Tax=Legionella santicrucis TaxID=45074 RepID=A0A0W0YA29_9GAMM|nr:cyanophycin synthetase [Legionella santicrucis]KTD53765.1 cyanophycin synthetase [Legionella santicrucis]